MTYEQKLVNLMLKKNISMVQAMQLDVGQNQIDDSNVFEFIDYLELQFNQDMNKVGYFSRLYFGQEKDMFLQKKEKHQ